MALDRGLCCRYNDSTDSRKKKTKQKEKQKHLEGATKKKTTFVSFEYATFSTKTTTKSSIAKFPPESIHTQN